MHSWVVVLSNYSRNLSIKFKTLGNTNGVASGHIKREEPALPVDVCCSKMPLLQLSINSLFTFDTTVLLVQNEI